MKPKIKNKGKSCKTMLDFHRRSDFNFLFNSDSLMSINEIKSGCVTDNLKHLELEHKSTNRKTKYTDIVLLLLIFITYFILINLKKQAKKAFVIITDNHCKTIELLAPDELERDRWVRVVEYLLVLCKKRKGILPETDA